MIWPVFQSRPHWILWQDYSVWLLVGITGHWLEASVPVIRLPHREKRMCMQESQPLRSSCLFYDLVSVAIHHLAVSSARCCYPQRPALLQGGLSHTEVLVTGGRSHTGSHHGDWLPHHMIDCTDRAWVLGSEKGVLMVSRCFLELRLVMCKEEEENIAIGKSSLIRSWSNKTCFKVSYILTTRLLVCMSTALNYFFLQGLNT